MPQRKDSENRPGERRPFSPGKNLGITLVAFLFVGFVPYSPGQHVPFLSKPAAKTQPAAAVDPLGRETPRGATIGFLKYIARQDFTTAARYLQQPVGQPVDVAQFTKEVQILSPRFKGDIVLLSDDPNGVVEPGLPPGEVRAGVFSAGGGTVDLILVRVDDRKWGKIWLISQGTVANLRIFAAQIESQAPSRADRFRLAVLRGPHMLGLSSTQWLGWLLSIPIAWLLAWLLAFLSSVPRRVWYGRRKLPFTTVWDTPLGMPLKCMIAIVLHSLFVYVLQPPLLYRVYYFRFMTALLAGCFAWFLSRTADRGFDYEVCRTRTQNKGGESILILMQRMTRVGIFIVAGVVALALLGLNVTETIAGLGIGGLAVALGAQKTLENLIGGVSLLMDKAVQVGDFCKIGDRLGTVEDIGLRSLKIRTLDQNMLVVPNGLLAQMQFENMKSRPKLLINQNFSLRIETRAEQLRLVLDNVQTMLNEHPEIELATSRVRITSFAGAAFELELFAYGKTGDWTHLTAIRQDIILKIAGIVEAAGTRLAAPTSLAYLSRDPGVTAHRFESANAVNVAADGKH